MNGINLTNADHREAVRVVKESKGALGIVRGGREGGGRRDQGGGREGGREGRAGRGMEGEIEGGREKKEGKEEEEREGVERMEGGKDGRYTGEKRE